jgi:hypothetical protein
LGKISQWPDFGQTPTLPGSVVGNIEACAVTSDEKTIALASCARHEPVRNDSELYQSADYNVEIFPHNRDGLIFTGSFRCY